MKKNKNETEFDFDKKIYKHITDLATETADSIQHWTTGKYKRELLAKRKKEIVDEVIRIITEITK